MMVHCKVLVCIVKMIWQFLLCLGVPSWYRAYSMVPIVTLFLGFLYKLVVMTSVS